ncbi:hypothetical protein, partial [Comamonas sp. B-9]|uniref:hypothetical protein n=1 Tax=Comamonas sp. B-9 TaxID=1055192 RepID=UPI0019553993
MPAIVKNLLLRGGQASPALKNHQRSTVLLTQRWPGEGLRGATVRGAALRGADCRLPLVGVALRGAVCLLALRAALGCGPLLGFWVDALPALPALAWLVEVALRLAAA